MIWSSLGIMVSSDNAFVYVFMMSVIMMHWCIIENSYEASFFPDSAHLAPSTVEQ